MVNTMGLNCTPCKYTTKQTTLIELFAYSQSLPACSCCCLLPWDGHLSNCNPARLHPRPHILLGLHHSLSHTQRLAMLLLPPPTLSPVSSGWLEHIPKPLNQHSLWTARARLSSLAGPPPPPPDERCLKASKLLFVTHLFNMHDTIQDRDP